MWAVESASLPRLSLSVHPGSPFNTNPAPVLQCSAAPVLRCSGAPLLRSPAASASCSPLFALSAAASVNTKLRHRATHKTRECEAPDGAAPLRPGCPQLCGGSAEVCVVMSDGSTVTGSIPLTPGGGGKPAWRGAFEDGGTSEYQREEGGGAGGGILRSTPPPPR